MIKKVATKGHAKDKAILVFASDTGCCPDGHKRCKYEINATALFPVTEITVTKIDGTDVVLIPSTPLANTAELVSYIKNAVLELGYAFTEGLGIENEHASVAVIGNKLCIKSELVFKSMKVGATTHNFVAKCTPQANCKYRITSVGDANPLTLLWNGASTSIPAYQYGVNTVADVKGIFDAALASNPNYMGVDVVDDVLNQAFTIDVHAPFGATLVLNGKKLSDCGCMPDFVV
jgi:hypothetical protein